MDKDKSVIRVYQCKYCNYEAGKEYIAVLSQSDKEFSAKQFFDLQGVEVTGNSRPNVYFVQYDLWA